MIGAWPDRSARREMTESVDELIVNSQSSIVNPQSAERGDWDCEGRRALDALKRRAAFKRSQASIPTVTLIALSVLFYAGLGALAALQIDASPPEMRREFDPQIVQMYADENENF